MSVYPFPFIFFANTYKMNTRILMFVFSGLASLFSCVRQNKPLAQPVYLDENAPIEKRVEDALSRMTLEEKIAVIHAQSKFSSKGVPRLGIPDIWCTDGPHGIRPEVLWDEWRQAGWTNDSCTAFPALSCLAATWNTGLAELYGKSIGEEARYRKKDVLLGPGVNICRTPLNGRNFEYLGEDPYLASQMVVPYVKGVQSNGVAACIKHFAVNNQELRRTETNSIVDDRTLYEIYLPAFKAAVKEGGAWAIMGSYNMYNGQYNCHNDRLLNRILKGEWGFDGVVISDWGGTRNDEEPITNGLDMEFGTWTDGLSNGASNAYDRYHLAEPYINKIKKGEVGVSELDDKVRRVLRLVFRTGMNHRHGHGKFTCPEHYEAARKIGAEGIVLLKNEGGLLPVRPEVKKLLVVGENAVKMMTVGGGSSSLKAEHEISPLEGIIKRFGDLAQIKWERGYIGDVTGQFDGVVTGQNLSESRSAQTLVDDAVAAAQQSDMVIFIGGLNKSLHQDSEGDDRQQLELPYNQGSLIEALAQANKNLVVVNISGSPVSMPWADKVPSIVQDWYLGSEAGNSLADVLSGDVNPSGKLPFTFPARIEDNPLKTERQYPGINRENSPYWDAYYDEGIFIGYRWYDTKGIEPQFAFGYGLSYTSFEYSNARLSKDRMRLGKHIEVSVNIRNTGDRAGAEIVQLYISDPASSLDRPAKELKGFRKVYLEPGESSKVTFRIEEKELSFFDPSRHIWVAETGKYIAHIAASSKDIRASLEFELR